MFSSTHLLAPPKFSGIGAAIVLLLLFPFSIIHAQSYTLKGRIIAEGAHGSRIDLSAGIIVAGYAPAAADPYLDSPVWKHATTPQSRNGNAFTAEDIPAGKYLIYAYVDHNGNRRLDRGEHLASYPHTVDLKGDVVRVELEFAPKIIYSRNNWKARDYLERNAKPKFRQGSRIPSLTATGYGRGNDVAIALGRHWRYAVEIGAGRGREEANGKPRPRNTSVKALVESIRTAPEQFKVSSTNYLVKQFTKNTDYYTAYPDAYITNSATGEVIRRTSPIASAGIFHAIGGKWAKDLNTIKRKFGDFHVDYLINGGESGLDVPAFGRSRWEQDDRIVADYESSPYKDNSSLGQQHWHKYVSVRKAQQEKWLITKLKQDLGRTQDVPPTYTFYNASHVPNTGRYGGNNQYCFDYREWRKRDVVDYSAPEYYYKHFNSGWTGMPSTK